MMFNSMTELYAWELQRQIAKGKIPEDFEKTQSDGFTNVWHTMNEGSENRRKADCSVTAAVMCAQKRIENMSRIAC